MIDNTTEEQYRKAFEWVANYEKEIIDHNNLVFNEIGAPAEEIEEMIEGCEIHAKVEIVDQPEGEDNNESYSFFTAIFVDQWSVGTEGDSFMGYIYARFDEDKWLKIPYNC